MSQADLRTGTTSCEVGKGSQTVKVHERIQNAAVSELTDSIDKAIEAYWETHEGDIAGITCDALQASYDYWAESES